MSCNKPILKHIDLWCNLGLDAGAKRLQAGCRWTAISDCITLRWKSFERYIHRLKDDDLLEAKRLKALPSTVSCAQRICDTAKRVNMVNQHGIPMANMAVTLSLGFTSAFVLHHFTKGLHPVSCEYKALEPLKRHGTCEIPRRSLGAAHPGGTRGGMRRLILSSTCAICGMSS